MFREIPSKTLIFRGNLTHRATSISPGTFLRFFRIFCEPALSVAFRSAKGDNRIVKAGGRLKATNPKVRSKTHSISSACRFRSGQLERTAIPSKSNPTLAWPKIALGGLSSELWRRFLAISFDPCRSFLRPPDIENEDSSCR